MDNITEKKNWFHEFLENNAFLTGVAIGSLALSFCARYFLEDTRLKDFRDGIGALFDALFIAAFLALVVDPALKRGFVKGATKDVFAFVFGYSLPPELREFLNGVVRVRVVRRECNLTWRIAPKEEPKKAELTEEEAAEQESTERESEEQEPKKVEVNLEAEFLVENFTNEHLTYRHKVFAWKSNPQEVGAVLEMYCNRSDRNNKLAEHYALKGDELKPAEDGFFTGDPIALLPQSASKDERYRVGARYYTEAESEGLDQFSVLETTITLNVRVEVPEKLRGWGFSIFPNPSDGQSEGLSLPMLDHTSNKYICSWEFKDKVFAPNEIILIRWQKAPVKPPSFKTIES